MTHARQRRHAVLKDDAATAVENRSACQTRLGDLAGVVDCYKPLTNLAFSPPWMSAAAFGAHI